MKKLTAIASLCFIVASFAVPTMAFAVDPDPIPVTDTLEGARCQPDSPGACNETKKRAQQGCDASMGVCS